MATIQLTNNTTLNITATSADTNATLNRYLKSPLTFLTPSGFDAIAQKKVADLDPTAFPLTANATGAGTFAVAGTSLGVQVGASAAIGLLAGDDKTDFLSSLKSPDDPPSAAIVSFQLQGKLSAGDTATVSDFSFGITNSANVTLTSFARAAGADTFADAAKRAIAALTIPHDIADLTSLPANAICRIGGSSCLQFTASVTYNVWNNPLATTSIPNLPSIVLNANATVGATLSATAKHISDHTITIAKLANGLIHLSVSLTKTDDLATSLTASAELTAGVGSSDALSFLLGKIAPNSTAEVAKIKADLPPAKVGQLTSDIKAAIDATLSNSLGASLTAILDNKESNNRLFLYEIDLTALDPASTAAVQSALSGDFTTITRSGQPLAGIRTLDSALTATTTVTHSLMLHLLGIFNYGSINTFVEKSVVDYTKDTHEIVLSDQTIDIDTNSLSANKLRELVAKSVTLTLPASANTPAAKTPITIQFFDRQAPTSPSTMRQFVNVLQLIGSPTAARAKSLLDQNLNDYGVSSLYLGLSLTPPQCRELFLASNGKPYSRAAYIQAACSAEQAILNSDPDNADRLTLFSAGTEFWDELENAGSAPNIIALLARLGVRQNARMDVTTLLWWSSAMVRYGQALANNKPLPEAGKAVVADGTIGVDEPWLALAAWTMLGKPAIDCLFTSSLLQPAALGAAGH